MLLLASSSRCSHSQRLRLWQTSTSESTFNICLSGGANANTAKESRVITARKRSCGKVMFLQVSVILFTGGGWFPSMPCRWYPSIPCRFPGPHPRGSLRGLAMGGGSPCPHPGGLQAHTQRGISSMH